MDAFKGSCGNILLETVERSQSTTMHRAHGPTLANNPHLLPVNGLHMLR